jgi:hypothetical protein
VIKFERENLSSARARLASSQARPDPANYTLKFGRHLGKTLAQVPDHYVEWLKTTAKEMLDNNEDLRDAVAHHERMQKPAKKKKTPKQPRGPNLVALSGKIIGWNGRRLDGPHRYGSRSRYKRSPW